MDLEKKPVVSDVGAWAMNVVSSVGIIMANKQLMSPNGYGFSFGNPPPPPAFADSGLIRGICGGLSVKNGVFTRLIWLGFVGG